MDFPRPAINVPSNAPDKRLGHTPSLVCRPIINDDQFGHGMGLRNHTQDGFGDKQTGVVGRDDNTDRGRNALCDRHRTGYGHGSLLGLRVGHDYSPNLQPPRIPTGALAGFPADEGNERTNLVICVALARLDSDRAGQVRGALVDLSGLLQTQIFSGVLSGAVVAVANHLLTKRKTAAEIEKLKAEAELTRAQAQQITNNLTNLSDKVGYKLSDVADVNEAILYSSERSDTFDFRLAKIDSAEGELEVKAGILSITRSNSAGTLQIWLESYDYLGVAHRRLLPKNESISGDRKLRASCEIKAIGGEHTILFLIKGEKDPGGLHMAEKRQRITSDEWLAVDAYFRVSPGRDCHFRIDDRSVSAPGSSLQIRKLVLAERISSPLDQSGSQVQRP
jgi:hypothetical protein